MSNLPPILVDHLRRSAAKRRRQAALRGAAEAGTVLVIGFAAAAAVDVLIRPGDTMRWINSLSVCTVAAGVFALRGVRPWLRRPDELVEAAAVEADARRAGVAGGDDDLLSSAVALVRQRSAAAASGSVNASVNASVNVSGTADWMIERTVALAGTRIVALNPLQLIDLRHARQGLLVCGSVTLAALASLAAPGVERLWLRVLVPWSTTVRPGDLAFIVAPGDVTLVHGDRLAVEVTVSAAVTSAALELTWDDGATEIRPLVETQGNAASVTSSSNSLTWRLDLDALAVGATYRAVAGGNASPRFRIDLIHPPQISELRLMVTPPAYTGRPLAIIPAAGAEILAGSRVEVLATLSGDPATSATLLRQLGAEQPMILHEQEAHAQGAHEQVASAVFTAPQPGPTGRTSIALGIQLAGKGAARESDTQRRWMLAIVADRPPQVSLSGRGLGGGLVGRSEVVVFDGKASDDEALRELFVELTAGDAPALRRRLELPAAGQTAVTVPVDLGELGLAAGDTVNVRLSATDSGGQTANSAQVQVTVADGEAAALRTLADALRSAARRLADADGLLGRLDNDLREFASTAKATTPVAQRSAIAVASQRADAVVRHIDEVTLSLQPARQAPAPLGSACASVVEELSSWRVQQAAVALSAVAGLTASSAVPEREQAAYAAHDAHMALTTLAGRLALVAARAEAGHLELRTAAAEPRLRRSAGILRGELGWSSASVGLNPTAMASLPPATLARAKERLVADGAVLVGVLPGLTGLADLLDRRGEDLRKLAAQAKAPADELGAIVNAPADTALTAEKVATADKALERAIVLAPQLATLAVNARELLDRALAERLPTRPAIDALARTRQQAEALRARADEWQHLPDAQAPSAAAAGAREVAAVAAGVRQIAVQLKVEQQRLLERAQAPDATFAERRSALAERRMISSEVGPALAAANRALTEVAKDPTHVRDRRGEVMTPLAQLTDSIARVEPAAAGARDAESANAARALLAAQADPDAASARPAAAAALAAALRRQGNDDLAKEVAATTDLQHLGELARRVLDRERDAGERPLTSMGDDLTHAAEPVNLADARDTLAGAPLELALAAEASRHQQREADATAQQRLSRDLAAELARADGPRNAELRDLARRADAIEGKQGDAAHAAELADAAAKPGVDGKPTVEKTTSVESGETTADRRAAQQLDGLSKQVAVAATAPDQRAAALAALDGFVPLAEAAAPGVTPPASRTAALQAQRLAALATQAEAARAGLSQARAEQQSAAAEAAANREHVATVQKNIAERLAATGRELSTAGPTVVTTAPDLARRIALVQPQVAERATAAERLAAPATAPGSAPQSASEKEAAAEAATHADAARAAASRNEAIAVREQAAFPLARAWHAAAASAPPADPGMKHIGEAGQQLAQLAGEQEEAARSLEQSLRREEAARQRVAAEIAAGAAVHAAAEKSLSDNQSAKSSGAAAGAEPAHEAATEAEKSQAAAQAAWSRAAAASTSAAKAADAATAIRAGRAAGDQNAADQQANASAAQADQAQNEAAAQAAQALTAEQAALAAAGQSGNPAQAAAMRAASAGRLAQARDAAMRAADASRQQRAAVGSDAAPATEQQAVASAAASREALLTATDGMGAAADQMAAQLERSAASAQAASAQAASAQAASAQAASAQVANSSPTPPTLSSAVASAVASAPAVLADSAIGRALATVAQAPDAEANYRHAAASLAAAANAARSAAALQSTGQAAAAGQALAQATASGKPATGSPPGSPGSPQAAANPAGTSGVSAGGKTPPPTPDTGQMPAGKAPPGIDQAAWAKLSEHVRQAIRSGGSERFAEEHQEAIRAYYRKLGEER